MKALVSAFNQEKALVEAFSVIVKIGCGTDGSICGTKLDTDWAVGSTGSRVFILVASYSPVIPSPDPDYKQRNYFTTSDPGQCQVQYLSSGDKQG